MANAKSVIRDIDLKNVTLNLNKNKSIISDFVGFNKNTGVWYNGVLSNLYCNNDKAADDIITIDNDVYKIINNSLYKNGVLVKDYSNIYKVKTEILGNINDNVIAYTPAVHIYYEGNEAYVKYGDTIVPVGQYYPNAIPYIIIDKADNTWCVIYGNYIVCKGMTEAKLLSIAPTAAIYSATKSKWYYVNDDMSLVNVLDASDVVTLSMTAKFIDGAVSVSGWTPKYKAVQLDSRNVFASIYDLSVAAQPTVTINKNIKTFKYLKGYYIEDAISASPYYSRNGDAIDMSVIPDELTLYVQPFTAWSKMGSIRTKFLSYDSFLTLPYSTLANYQAIIDKPIDNVEDEENIFSKSSVDGPTSYYIESTPVETEFITLAGSTAGTPEKYTSFEGYTMKYLGEANYPKLIGLFNESFTPEWMFTYAFNFKLIYNKDALVGISKYGSIVVTWNDVDENTLTMTDNDIYYFSLSNNAWVHINISTENKLEAIKVGNNLLLNSLVDNCYRKDKLFTYNVDTTLANFIILKPRVGLINTYGAVFYSYIVPKHITENIKIGNYWMPYLLEAIKNTEKYFISIASNDNDGPIWASTQLLNYTGTTNVRKEGWQFTSSPAFDTTTIDYSYYLNNTFF